MNRPGAIWSPLPLAGERRGLYLWGCGAFGAAPDPTGRMFAMAKGQMRSNKEAKKPKKDKVAPAAGAVTPPASKKK